MEKKRKEKKETKKRNTYLVERLFRGAVFCIDAFRFDSLFFPLHALARNAKDRRCWKLNIAKRYCSLVRRFLSKQRSHWSPKEIATNCLPKRLPRLLRIYIYTFNKTLVSSLILLQFLVFLSYMWKREKVKFFPRYFFITKHYFPRYDTKIHKPLKETVLFS